jgi:hypothetical protein
MTQLSTSAAIAKRHWTTLVATVALACGCGSTDDGRVDSADGRTRSDSESPKTPDAGAMNDEMDRASEGGVVASASGHDGEGSALDGLIIVSDDPSDSPLSDLSDDWQERFDGGDVAFETVFRASQGLGPVYIRHSCASCHADDARGPGAVRKMVHVEDDGWSPADDQSMFPFGHTVRPQSIDPDSIPGIDVPEEFEGLLVTSRMGPPVFGRGAMEAVLDSEIERLESEQAESDDGITGRINRVTYASRANPESEFHSLKQGDSGLIGRFGLKARIATLDDFAADAYQGDMGITSPLRPNELPNPDGHEDDEFEGTDIELSTVNLAADYVRLLRIPARETHDGDGERLFDEVGCSVCHASNLATDPNYPIEGWADTRVDVYTDMLLHSMGSDLADGMEDGNAKGDEWRTAPLIGLRHLRGYMHDSRAETILEAIEAHSSPGSEANDVVARFEDLESEQQRELIRFVESL